MNKAELIKEVSDRSGLPQKDIVIALDSILDVITDTVCKGEKVKLVNFGVFEKKRRAAKRGVNPREPEKKILIQSKNVASWKAGKEFANKVNE